MNFLDEIIISVKSGHGGRGCESYLRRADRKMIPNGGDGGDGGDVIIRCDAQTGSFFPLQSKRIFEAESGGAGAGNNRYGQKGKPLILKVPCGTTVYDRVRNLLLRDLLQSGDEVVAVRGGRGGYGNHAGRPIRESEEGKLLELLFSFTTVADIFMVGLPNSGKTTLLHYLTGAHVIPTEHPFATKSPCLGTYRTSKGSLQICELPSIYNHSLEGKGLGSAFLKHLKRSRLIFLVLDPVNPFARSLKEGYDILLNVLEEFDPTFLKVRRVVIVNKMDLKEAKKITARQVKFKDPVHFISALRGTGVSKLMREAVSLLAKES